MMRLLRKMGVMVWRGRGWAARLLLLVWLVSVIQPPGERVMLGEPQTVQAVEPHVCTHTRLIDEVQEWKIQRTLQLVREMGADTIVEFFPWAYIESQPGRYDWSQADRIIRHAENHGIRIIARMGFVPYWARDNRPNDATTLNYLPPESYDEFAQFVATFARRYAGTISHLIIWNEPNLSFEWGYEAVDPAGYAALLRTVYPAAKEANPDAVILGAALAPTLEPAGSSHGLDDTVYLRGMFEAGAGDYMDALAVHTYGFTQPPEAEPHPDSLNFRRAELLYAIANEYRPNLPIYITETGWNDHPRWTKSVRPSLRVAYTIHSLDYAKQNWPQVEEVCIWAFRYPIPTFSYPDNFTLVTVDFQLKPLYYAVQAYAQGTERNRDLWLSPPANE